MKTQAIENVIGAMRNGFLLGDAAVKEAEKQLANIKKALGDKK